MKLLSQLQVALLLRVRVYTHIYISSVYIYIYIYIYIHVCAHHTTPHHLTCNLLAASTGIRTTAPPLPSTPTRSCPPSRSVLLLIPLAVDVGIAALLFILCSTRSRRFCAFAMRRCMVNTFSGSHLLPLPPLDAYESKGYVCASVEVE